MSVPVAVCDGSDRDSLRPEARNKLEQRDYLRPPLFERIRSEGGAAGEEWLKHLYGSHHASVLERPYDREPN